MYTFKGTEGDVDTVKYSKYSIFIQSSSRVSGAHARQRFNLLSRFCFLFSLFPAFSLVPFEGIDFFSLQVLLYHFRFQLDSAFTLLNRNPPRLVV